MPAGSALLFLLLPPLWLYTALMASIHKNGAQLTSQKKSLTQADLATLREFVNKRLAEPRLLKIPALLLFQT
jgi:hypothetical protein